jgi:hypothetical protein
MPRFFFRLCDDLDCEDPEGLDLPDLHAAQEEAIRNIRSILAEEVGRGNLPLKGRIEVRDETGSVALYVSFREALVIDS